MKRIRITGDGHCLYRAVARSLNPVTLSAETELGTLRDREDKEHETVHVHTLRRLVAALLDANPGEEVAARIREGDSVLEQRSCYRPYIATQLFPSPGEPADHFPGLVSSGARASA